MSNKELKNSTMSAALTVQDVGGKAYNLLHLQKIPGLKVPTFTVLPTHFFREFMAPIQQIIGQELSQLQTANLGQVSDKINGLILTQEFPSKMREQIREKIKCEVGGDLAHDYYSVRSSASDEDGAQFSFAGQMDSFLYVKEEEHIFASIKKCFASAYSERVLSYRQQHQLGFDIQLAVIVQVMVFGEVSGVLFTGNPINNDPEQMVVSATYGIGEGVVSGELDCDQWVLGQGQEGQVVSHKIVAKEEKITFDQKAGIGTIKIPVEKALMSLPCLNAEQLQNLLVLGKTIEKFRGNIPQDIEWTIRKGQIYLLQTRPITTMRGVDKSFKRIIWDNSNIIESYNGVTTPLTFAFASYAYENVYRQFYAVMGTPPAQIEEMSGTFANMLGLYRGQIYYNLNCWYETLRLLPGYEFNREFMEAMMGVKEKAGEESSERPGVWQRYLVELPKLLMGIGSVVRKYLSLPKDIPFFFKNLQECLQWVHRLPLHEMNEKELLDCYQHLQVRLLSNWKTPIVNDLFTMIFYGVLKKLIVAWNLDSAGSGSLQNDLLCGEGDLESTRPTKDLIELTNWIRQEARIKEYVLATSEEEIVQQLLLNAPHLSLTAASPYYLLREKILHYLHLWGFRCINELKLEEDSLKENPNFMITMIKNYLQKDAVNLVEMEERERKIRLLAEEKVKQNMQDRRILLFTSRAKIFQWVLQNARKSVKTREELRFARTKVFGTVRELMNAMGSKWQQHGYVEQAKDIYYLTVDEIRTILEGRSIINGAANILSLITLRKNEYATYLLGEEPPERFYTYGPFYIAEKIVPILENPEADLELGPNLVKGTPCSPGKIVKECKIIMGPKENCQLNGEILITTRTDPGWVPLFPSISGLLIERGSILSHSAVVAREMGIPTIVGLTNVTKKAVSGDIVAMDGSKGIAHLKGEMIRVEEK